MSFSPLIVAIDWLSWTWKWTSSRLLAQKIWCSYLDTWAMYRATTLYAIRNKLLWSSDQELADMLDRNIEFDFFLNENGVSEILLNWEQIESYIRSPEIWINMTPIVTCKPLRMVMTQKIQNFGKKWSLVADWRDMWTIVFPHAQVKIFMTCDAEIRAQRRKKQLESSWESVDLIKIKEEIVYRDKRDYLWDNAVNVIADDAIRVDTSYCTIDEQVEKIYAHCIPFLKK